MRSCSDRGVRRRFWAGLGTLLIAVALAACGGASRSAPPFDPAALTPSDVELYTSLSAGATAPTAVMLDRFAASLMRRSAPGRLAAWLRNGIAVVITSPGPDSTPADDWAVILPRAQRGTVARTLSTLTRALGAEQGRAVGADLVVGGRRAVDAIAATRPSDSLASLPLFRSAATRFGPHRLLTVFARTRAPRPGSIAAAVSTTHDQLRLDLVTPGIASPFSGVDIRGLPLAPWLALGLSGTGGQTARDALLTANVLPQLLDLAGPTANATWSGALHAGLAALDGPLALQASGSSLAALLASLTVTTASARHAASLMAVIHALVDRIVPGRATGARMSFDVGSAPPIKFRILGNQITISRDYPVYSAFLTLTSALGAQPGFRTALRSLPSSASPWLYLNFAALRQLMRSSGRPIPPQLRHLSFLVGGTAGDDARIVLTSR